MVKDLCVPSLPVSGATIRIFDISEVFVTGGVSGADGIVDLTLLGDAAGIGYHVRFYKFGVSFVSPQAIKVYDPPPVPDGNNFKVFAEINAASASSDARLSRVYGFLRDAKGDVFKGKIRFSSTKPLIVDGDGIFKTDILVVADSNGLFTVDLFKTGEYTAMAEFLSNDPRLIKIPTSDTVNIADLLFPIIISIVYTPVAPFNMSVGDVLEITPVVQATDGRTLTGVAHADLIWSVDDISVASLTTSIDKLTIKAIKIGNTSLRATRKETGVSRIPDTLTGETAAIVVT